MKSGRRLLVSLMLVVVSHVFAAAAATADSLMPLPVGQQSFPAYGPIAAPLITGEAPQAMPIGLGLAASGGSTLDIRVATVLFAGPVDIYLAYFAPSLDPQNVYFVTSSGTLDPLSLAAPSGMIPAAWVPDTSGGIDRSFGSIPVSLLPAGTYTFFLLVTPAGRLDSYYLWASAIEVANNVLPVTVNGSLCSINSYLNKPCVSITVCTPGGADCQTIDDIIVDTGSVGLRIFSQALTVSLSHTTIADGLLAECIQFGDGSSDWGPVKFADVVLGNEPAVQVPVHVLDSAFGSLPFTCRNADQSPAAAGFNGILGVGLFRQDCGTVCTRAAQNGMYYHCNGTDCIGTTVDLSAQVQNPVAHLPRDNNGVIIQLPEVPPGGLPAVDGSLVLGIGTQSNNNLAGVTAYRTNAFGEFVTTFNGLSVDSFIDSGSNGLFFSPSPASLLPVCVPPLTAWFCPPSTTGFSAINTAATGSPSGDVSFMIGNFLSLFISSNNVFSEIGGNFPGGFDWGLPFYFGRSVAVGFEGTDSVLGTGPYWAY